MSGVLFKGSCAHGVPPRDRCVVCNPVPTCETCRFRSERPFVNPDRGTAEFHNIMFACKRRAPVVTGGMMSRSETIWPMVSSADWCGEYVAKVQP